jgi:hypothetical protein
MSDQPDFKGFSQDLDKNLITLEAAIIELQQNIDNISTLFENERLYDAFRFIRKLTQAESYRQYDHRSDVFIKHNFQTFLTKFLQYLSPTCGQLIPYNGDTIEKRKIELFDSSQYILNFLVSNSSIFRIEFFKTGGVKELFNFLKNQEFVTKFNSHHFFSTILGNINWLSRHSDAFKNEWRSLDAVELLLNIARTYPTCRMPSYSAFANIANDTDISTLPDMHVIVPMYVQCVNTTATEMNKPNSQLKRHRITFDEEDNDQSQMYEVYFVQIDISTTHSITGIMLTLYRLSINNKIKYDLYVKYKLQELLPVIIYKGSEIEKKYALRLLAQLCFDPQVNDLVYQNDELKNYIQSLSVDTTLQIKSIIKICEQILWTIEANHKASNNKTTLVYSVTPQVMISYNSASRSLCIRIKEELEKSGFKVWIDISEIHGSSLESMARAIETSDYILMCVTEKYRQSINCQAEAQYAFKLQKKIVPLIMQEGYERVDGWLGMIIGDKIYISFIKYKFEESVQRLLHEISLKAVGNNVVPQFAKVSIQPVMSVPPMCNAPKQDSVKDWSEEKVNKWFNDNNVHEGIIKEVKPCDGDLLYQIHLLQKDAPEFFYQSITKDKSVDLKAALLFSKKLKEIFNS